jgi:hypothetical protein
MLKYKSRYLIKCAWCVSSLECDLLFTLGRVFVSGFTHHTYWCRVPFMLNYLMYLCQLLRFTNRRCGCCYITYTWSYVLFQIVYIYWWEYLLLEHHLQVNMSFVFRFYTFTDGKCRYYIHLLITVFVIGTSLTSQHVFCIQVLHIYWWKVSLLHTFIDNSICLLISGFTHLLMEGVVVVTHRQLSQSHPIFKLLAPHFLYLIAINA